MNQIPSPQEMDQLSRISFSNLKQFSCSTPTIASPPARSYSTSRKNKIIVRFPTEIFQIKEKHSNQPQKPSKALNADSTKSIKFPRLENRKLQKQKRGLSTMCLREKAVEYHSLLDLPKPDYLSKLNLSKNRLCVNQVQKKLDQNRLKFNNYMKIFTHKKGKVDKK